MTSPHLAPGAARVAGLVTVLDVRYRMGGPGGRAEHERGTCPAPSSTWTPKARRPPGEVGRHPPPPTDVFEAAMRRGGVRDGKPGGRVRRLGPAWRRTCVVAAALPRPPDVRVLDGAWPAWVEAGRRCTGTTLPGRRGDFTARPGHAGGGRRRARACPVLVDARAPSATAGGRAHRPGGGGTSWRGQRARRRPTCARTAPSAPRGLARSTPRRGGRTMSGGCLLRVRGDGGARHHRAGAGRDQGRRSAWAAGRAGSPTRTARSPRRPRAYQVDALKSFASMICSGLAGAALGDLDPGGGRVRGTRGRPC